MHAIELNLGMPPPEWCEREVLLDSPAAGSHHKHLQPHTDEEGPTQLLHGYDGGGVVSKGEGPAVGRVSLEGGLVKDDELAIGQTSTQEVLLIHSGGAGTGEE